MSFQAVSVLKLQIICLYGWGYTEKSNASYESVFPACPPSIFIDFQAVLCLYCLFQYVMIRTARKCITINKKSEPHPLLNPAPGTAANLSSKPSFMHQVQLLFLVSNWIRD